MSSVSAAKTSPAMFDVNVVADLSQASFLKGPHRCTIFSQIASLCEILLESPSVRTFTNKSSEVSFSCSLDQVRNRD